VQSAFPDGVNWDILCAHPQLIAKFPPISHPRIERVRLMAIDDLPFNPVTFLLSLRRFSEITWLDYEGKGIYTTLNSPEEDMPRIFMPNLRIFYYRSSGFLQLPLSRIILPSLRYLAIHFWLPSNDIALNDILLAYGQTLQSVVIQLYLPSKDPEIIQFPPWHKLPRMQNLLLSRQWSIQFDPVPPTHPLKKLIARHASFEALPSFLDAANMRHLLLIKADWTDPRDLMLDRDEAKVQDVGTLEEKAKIRGIRFAVSWEDEDEEDFRTRKRI
jgi:hypothetical protein